MNDVEWLSIRDAAARFGLGRTLLFRLVKQHRINSALVGNRRLVEAASIRALIAAHQKQKEKESKHEQTG